jgi:hypothetical protein
MPELYLEELRYQLGDDPEPWIEKMKRVQEVYNYDDAKMVLLAEMCMKKPTSEFVHQFSRTSIQAVYAGFRRLYELCKQVQADITLRMAFPKLNRSRQHRRLHHPQRQKKSRK